MRVLKKIDLLAYRRFRNFLQGRSGKKLSGLYVLFKMAVALSLTVFIVNIILNREGYGPWGDFIGGTLNPILTFLTFMGLLITIVIQQSELRATREEMKRSSDALSTQNESIRRQSFDSSLNKMLALHNDIISGIMFYSPSEGRDLTGRHAFRPMYTKLSDQYREKRSIHLNKITDHDIVLLAYRGTWASFQPNLGHYFRYLYNIVKYVKENSYSITEHMRLVRSQISDYELLLLFYNLLTPQGAKFKDLAEQLALLDNLPTTHLLARSHLQYVYPSAFGRQGPPTMVAALPIDLNHYESIARR